jgi:membrane protease YdiL (CAAX protease family)
MKFIQLAFKGNNEWWAYLVTIILLLIGWQFIGVIPLTVTAFLAAENSTAFMEAAQDSFTSLGIDSNLFLIMIILMFLAGLVSLLLGVKFIHKRKILSVITTRSKIDWNRVFYAFSIWALIGVIMITAGYFLSPEDYIWNFKPVPFIILLLISFFFLPIQTSMEEILFRGYLLQGFGTWFKKGFVAIILTSVIFGLLHGLNPEVEKLGWISMIYYIGTGLLLGIFTIMDEGTELALGFHAANNMIAAVLVTADWTVFQTDALLIDTSEPSVGWEMYFPVFVLFPLVLYVFSKRYGWTDWKEKMFGKVTKPIELNEDELLA